MLWKVGTCYAVLLCSCLCSGKLVQLSLKGWCLLMLLIMLRVVWWSPYQRLLSSVNLNNNLLGGAAAIWRFVQKTYWKLVLARCAFWWLLLMLWKVGTCYALLVRSCWWSEKLEQLSLKGWCLLMLFGSCCEWSGRCTRVPNFTYKQLPKSISKHQPFRA